MKKQVWVIALVDRPDTSQYREAAWPGSSMARHYPERQFRMAAVSQGLQSSLPTRGLRFLEYGYQQGPRFKKFSKQLFEIQVNEQTKKIWRKFGPCNVTSHCTLWCQLEDTVILIGTLRLFDPALFPI